VVASAIALGGGGLLAADGSRDADGFLSTDSHALRSSTPALVSDNLDMDLGGAVSVDGDVFGEVRLQADPASGRPLFVGIARTADVEQLLDGVARTVVTDFDDDPAAAEQHDVAGARHAAAPADADIWVASSEGRGRQTLDWHVEDGDWSVVAMNADGSAGVTAEVAAGVSVPWIDEAGWGALGAAAALYALALALLAGGLRRRGRARLAPSVGPAAPAA
jgi:hypothetical protein